jgi:type I restriction enzyme S subunit
LRELIAELCPEGVQTALIDELYEFVQPTKYLVESATYGEFGTPVLTAGKTFILGYTIEKTGIYQASPDDPVVIFDDFTTSFKWVDFPFKAKSSAMKMITAKTGNSMDLRFLFHWMGVKNFIPGEHARHWISVYSQFEIPVPPLHIQREIVSILDKLDALVNDLSFGLPAEIIARRKQYEYYRNQLLTFKELKTA